MYKVYARNEVAMLRSRLQPGRRRYLSKRTSTPVICSGQGGLPVQASTPSEFSVCNLFEVRRYPQGLPSTLRVLAMRARGRISEDAHLLS